MANGQVEDLETFRFVVSLSTFSELTELFVRTLSSIRPGAVQPGLADTTPGLVANDDATRSRRVSKS